MLQSLYGVLKMRAHRCQTGHVRRIETTALVHEAYIRLAESGATWQSEAHFLCASSNTMRQVLVDQARAALAAKRGGAWKRRPIVDFPMDSAMSAEDVLEIHDALERFAVDNPQKAKLVELRIFAGLTEDAASEAIGVSRATGKRYWAVAKLEIFKLIRD